ncbi:MAG: TadE/TadG family type IV pilus assembly protein [Novosphingobium sp.]
MMRPRFIPDQSGTATVELVLLLPIIMALLFGGLEAGNFVWTQHKLIQGVRDGARFAARLPVSDLCNGATAQTGRVADIKLITRTGQLANSSAAPTVQGWTSSLVSVTISCQSYVATGIYTPLDGNGPVVSVATGSVPYPSIFGSLGFIHANYRLSAKSNAAVMGI